MVMRIKFQVLIFLAITFLLSAFVTQAQDAFITGRVVDEKGEPLPFVNVISVEHRVGKATDFDGFYKFRIPAGKNTIRCSFTGYISDSVIVEAKAGQTIQKDFILFESTTTKSEVEIFAIRKTNTEIAVIQEVKESKQVVNAMSAEMIEKTGDSDASGGFKRGDRVFHIKFGYGRILVADGAKLTVAFDKAGEKKVVASFVERA